MHADHSAKSIRSRIEKTLLIQEMLNQLFARNLFKLHSVKLTGDQRICLRFCHVKSLTLSLRTFQRKRCCISYTIILKPSDHIYKDDSPSVMFD